MKTDHTFIKMNGENPICFGLFCCEYDNKILQLEKRSQNHVLAFAVNNMEKVVIFLFIQIHMYLVLR